MFDSFKSRFLTDDVLPRRVLFGLFAGLRLHLNLRHQLQVLLGLWERETNEFVRRSLQGCQWAMDVGACKGEFTLLFLAQSGIQRVIAVEPCAEVESQMQDNLILNNRFEDVRLVRCQKMLGVQSKQNVATLDELGVDLEGPGFIKIDVDGGELDVLRGGVKLLAKLDVRLLIETHSVELELECLAFLQAMGYQCEIIPNAWWRTLVPENRPIAHNRWIGVSKC